MKKTLLLVLVLILSSCAKNNSEYALGEHNLSKGKCKNIQNCKGGKCKDESVQYVCEMIGGEFQPREFKDKNKWVVF